MWTSASGPAWRRRSSGWIPPQPTATLNTLGRVPCLDVVRRVPDVRGIGGIGVESLERLEHRVGLGLVPLGVLRADDDVHGLPELREPVERKADGAEALRRDDPEPTALAPQRPGGGGGRRRTPRARRGAARCAGGRPPRARRPDPGRGRASARSGRARRSPLARALRPAPVRAPRARHASSRPG